MQYVIFGVALAACSWWFHNQGRQVERKLALKIMEEHHGYLAGQMMDTIFEKAHYRSRAERLEKLCLEHGIEIEKVEQSA